jgi:hypothetical protein
MSPSSALSILIYPGFVLTLDESVVDCISSSAALNCSCCLCTSVHVSISARHILGQLGASAAQAVLSSFESGGLRNKHRRMIYARGLTNIKLQLACKCMKLTRVIQTRIVQGFETLW